MPTSSAGTSTSSFNSRSREGSDQGEREHHRYSQRFNSRSREGSDQGAYKQDQHPRVSIHAPVKGATAWTYFCVLFASSFNSRSREGSDFLFVSLSTQGRLSFNSRSREGSDAYPPRRQRLPSAFQFTLP